MIGRRRSRSLRQFLKLASEDVVHSKVTRKLLGDVQTMGSSRIEIDLLERQEIGLLRCEKFRDIGQMESAVDVPVHDSDRLKWRELQLPPHEVARQNVFHARLSRRPDVLGCRLERCTVESAPEVEGANPCDIT